jgi:hypothetical protein
MVTMKLLLSFAVVTSLTAAHKVTPVEKVLELLKELKDQVMAEGKAESASYDEFACFCRDKTQGLASTIDHAKEEIDILSADIEADTKEKVVKMGELEDRKKKQEKDMAALAEAKAQLAKDNAEYDYDAADLQKAIDSLRNAVTALNDAKPSAAALIALGRVVRMGTVASALRRMGTPGADALLQSGVDPNSPEYKYHSQGIVDTLDGLLEEFTAKKTELDAEWTKTKAAAELLISGLEGDIENNKNVINDLKTKIDDLAFGIAADTEALVVSEAMLKDDKLYLKDLTARCEARAADWDQRSQMRASELKALTEALSILKQEVVGRDEAVNKRAFAQTKAPKVWSAPPSLVQVRSHSGHDAAQSQQQQTAQGRVVEMLTEEAQRLGSRSLSALAMEITADPFAKVKYLIKQLIERLLRESIDEATKEGFCNTELGVAKKDRNFRYKDVLSLNTEIKGLELKRDELDLEITELVSDIAQLTTDLQNATTMREQEHDQNMEVIKTSKEGLEAVTQAIVIIKTFYSQAAKATALIQASPVDEDTSGPGFEGNYGGKQVASHGIIGMLEVIKTDFERTIMHTQASEEKSHAEFIEFERVSKTDISGKSKKEELDRADLKTTLATIVEKMSALTTAQGLLDAALKRLTDLKPMCTDFGQSYADRVAKREEEILALKHAICALEPDDPSVEPQCK